MASFLRDEGGPSLRPRRVLKTWMAVPLFAAALLHQSAPADLLGAAPALSSTAAGPNGAPVTRSEGTTVLDGILVVVNGQPITRSRAELFQALLKVWKGDLGWPAKVAGYEQLAPQDLERLLILDELLFEGASGTSTLKVLPEDVILAALETRNRLGTPEAWQAFASRYELTEDFLRELMTRRLRIQAWIQLKVGPVRVSESDIREYFESHPSNFEGQSFENARGGIEAELKSSRQRDRFNLWVEGLRDRASVQVPSRELGR